MTQLRYVGRAPDADSSVVHKEYVDGRYDEIKVDEGYISPVVASAAIPLVTQSYVDTQDALRASKTAVDASDNGYLLATQRGAASGVVPLDENAYIPTLNLPTLITERKPKYISGSGMSASTVTVDTITAKDTQLSALSIPDPGYPYIPLLFAQVRGGSVDGNAASRMLGTGSFGQLSILRSDDVKYSWCLTTSHKTLDFHTAVPFADASVDPASRPPMTGASTFRLWAGLWSGSTYRFTSTGFIFYALVFPGF